MTPEEQQILQHKQARERFYSVAIQVAAKCSKMGFKETSKMLVEMVDEMKSLPCGWMDPPPPKNPLKLNHMKENKNEK